MAAVVSDIPTVEPLSKAYFIDHFGWGENWLDNHDEVEKFGSIDEMTCHRVFSLYDLLSNNAYEKGEPYSWPKFFKIILLVLPPHVELLIDCKKLRRRFEAPFWLVDRKSKKKGARVFGCPRETKDNIFFHQRSISFWKMIRL